MKSLTVNEINNLLEGEFIQGNKDLQVEGAAYRVKQLNQKNMVLFCRIRIVGWEALKPFFPLVVITDQPLKRAEHYEDLTIIKVEDVTEAYWKFIEYYRGLFSIPVIAITGTAGKTSTKEMIKHILSFDKDVVATNITSNSRTSHLHYLLSMDENTDVAIFETAVGRPGDIVLAGKYYKPTIGIITNIGAHHLNYCRTPEQYFQAKAEMLDVIRDDGLLILNGDDYNNQRLNTSKFKERTIKVGCSPEQAYYASHIQYGEDSMSFIVHHQRKQWNATVHGYGEHQVYNALAALAAVHQMGIDLLEAIKKLATYKKFNRQLQLLKGINGATLLDDTWSMATTSLKSALHVLKDIGHGKRKIAIIGSMTDLGHAGYEIHEQAGKMIAEMGVDVLMTVGDLAKVMAEQAKKSGLQAQIYSFKHPFVIYRLIKRIADENTVILIRWKPSLSLS